MAPSASALARSVVHEIVITFGIDIEGEGPYLGTVNRKAHLMSLPEALTLSSGFIAFALVWGLGHWLTRKV